MSKTTTTISFRCPPEILEQIDAIGREHFPKFDNSKTNSGCDRSKTLFAIIQAGIAALSDGEVPVIQPRKTELENSKTGFNLDEVECLVKKLINQNSPVVPDEWELSQLIRKEINNSLSEGDIAAKLERNRENIVNHLNEINERLVRVEGALADEKKPELTDEKKPDSTNTKKPDSTNTKKEPTEADKTDVIELLGIQKIVNDKERYSQNSKELFDLVEKNKDFIESKLGIRVEDMRSHSTRGFNKIIKALGYDCDSKQVPCPSGEPGKRLTQYFVTGKI